MPQIQQTSVIDDKQPLQQVFSGYSLISKDNQKYTGLNPSLYTVPDLTPDYNNQQIQPNKYDMSNVRDQQDFGYGSAQQYGAQKWDFTVVYINIC